MPKELQGVYDYTTDCIQQTTKEGIQLLGLQGGFITLPREINNNPTSYLEFDKLGIIKIPYWHYNKQLRMPTLTSMQNELNEYITANIGACINEYAPFQERLHINITSTLAVSTTITDAAVNIRLNQPIQAQFSTATITYTDDFIAVIPVKLKKIWELATATLRAENNQSFIENATISILAAHPDIPLDGLDFTCTPQKWRLTDVRDRLSATLTYAVAHMRIKNTIYPSFLEPEKTYAQLGKNAAQITKALINDKQNKINVGTDFSIDTPADAYDYFNLFFDVGLTEPIGLRSAFMYSPDYGLYLNAQPNDNGILKSNTGKSARTLMNFLCVQQYHFTYDVIYPIVHTIKDDNAFNGEGFLFQYAFPILIDDNAPNRKTFSIMQFEGFTTDEEFCNKRTGRTVDIRALSDEGGFTLEALPDVNLTYTCFRQQCNLGTTDNLGGTNRYYDRLPEGCNAPFITATATGYLPKTLQLTDNTLNLPLARLKTFNVIVKKDVYNSDQGVWLEENTTLSRMDNVSIHVALNNNEYDQFINYPEDKTITLVDGDASYNIRLRLSVFDKPIGGYDAEAINITFSDIENKNTVIFHVFEYTPRGFNQDYNQSLITYLYDGDYKTKLRPTFE